MEPPISPSVCWIFSQKNLNTIQVLFQPSPPRHDKYEGKPIYWIEEEIEVEWPKTTSRSRTETGEYQVEGGSLGDAMADAAMPVTVDMTDLAQGEVVFGWILVTILINFDMNTDYI